MNTAWGLARLLAIGALAIASLSSVGIIRADDDNTPPPTTINEPGGPSGSADQSQTSGDVTGINTLTDPAVIKIANVDGEVLLYVYNRDELNRSAVKVGDFISIIGQKINEHEYVVDTIRVDRRAPSASSATTPTSTTNGTVTKSSNGNGGGGNGNGGNGNGGNGNGGNGNGGNGNGGNGNGGNGNGGNSNGGNGNGGNSNGGNGNGGNGNGGNGNDDF